MLYLGGFFCNLQMEISMSVVYMLFKTLQDEFAQFYQQRIASFSVSGDRLLVLFCFLCVFVPLFHPPSFVCVTVKACFQDNVVFSLQCHDIQRQSHGNGMQNVAIYKLLTELPSCQLALQQALNSNCIRCEVLFQRAFPPQNFSSFCFLIARQEFQPRKVSCSFQQLPQLHVHLVQPCSHLGLPRGLDQFHQVRLRLEIRGKKKICFK